ncbi:phage tail protein [Cytobacillus firmus]|uniref:phage tail protein n=1 Tax=Cytobacillus firmus TaxID=1399 RepID=UPI001D8894EE|nr:tail protein [Cytobacillus firmus]
MATVVTEFDAVSLKNVSAQFKTGGTPAVGTSFGCAGSIEGETESVVIEKKCAGLTQKSIAKPQKMALTYAGHLPVAVLRDVFGLSNTGLKPGVYSYGQSSKPKEFILTGDIVDEFEDVTKLIAFPAVTSSTGLKIQSIENGAEEVAQIELEFTVLPDSAGQFYYEALVPELDDQTVAEQWHSAFTRTLVEATPAP